MATEGSPPLNYVIHCFFVDETLQQFVIVACLFGPFFFFFKEVYIQAKLSLDLEQSRPV